MPSWLRYLLCFGLLGPVIDYLAEMAGVLFTGAPFDADTTALFLIFAVFGAPIGLGLGLVPALITGWLAWQLSLRGLSTRTELLLTVLCGEVVTASGAAIGVGPAIWGLAPGRVLGALIAGLIGALAAAVCWRMARRRQADAGEIRA